MFKGIRNGHAEYAECACDVCGTTVQLGARLGDNSKEINNRTSIIRNLQKRGWTNIKSILRCPQCEAARKAPKKPPEKPPGALGGTLASWDDEDTQKEPEMDTQSEPRQPTKEQKREILAMLDISYDADAQRYKGTDTDKSVAAALGNGIMWGWVAKLREEFYGPDGNETVELALKEVAAWRESVDAKLEAVRATVTELDTAKGEIAKLLEKLTALVKK